MKTKDLIKLLEKTGDGKRESIVRHRETDEELAKAIIKRNGLR